MKRIRSETWMRREQKIGRRSTDIFFFRELEKLESYTLVLQQTQKERQTVGCFNNLKDSYSGFPSFISQQYDKM